jgi:hypothetical protein
MSEASESLHLFRSTPRDAERLARSSMVSLRIVASNERWTTVVTFDDEFDLVADAAPVLSLHWSFYDDFGLTLTFYEAGREIGRLEWTWHQLPPEVLEPPSAAMRARFEEVIDRLDKHGAIASAHDVREIEGALRSGAIDPTGARERVARALDLPAYEWLSPAYCREVPLEVARQIFPEAEDVWIE